MTWLAAMGADEVSPELEGIFLTFLGIGGGGGMLFKPAVPAAAKVAARRPWAGLPGSPIDAAAVDGRSMIVELIDPAFSQDYRNLRMATLYRDDLCVPNTICAVKAGKVIAIEVRRMRKYGVFAKNSEGANAVGGGLNQFNGSKELRMRCHDARAQESTAMQCSCCEARMAGDCSDRW